MKKLLIVLTVVSMAALLFTGCLPTPNTAPVITYSASQTATTGTEFTSTVTATDAEGDTLTFSVSDGPTDMVIDSATGVISGWTPAVAGTETVLVTVTDGTDTSTLLVTITVTEPVEPVETEITIAVAGEYLEVATGKTYVQGGNREIIVTFPDVVENPVVKVGTVVVPVFTLDNKVFKGTGTFVGDAAVLIKVTGVCEDICAAKSVVVDSSRPYAKMLAKAIECDCDEGWKLKIYNNWSDDTDCVDLTGCCATDLKSWNVKIYDENPWEEECCDPEPCILPIAEADGTACPITITTECIGDVFTPTGWEDFFDNTFWVIATLTDNVNNQIKYLGEVGIDGGEDELSYFRELYIDVTSEDCWCYAESLEDAADLILGDCDGTPTTECWVEPLEPCPEVTFVPSAPIVGQEVLITIDYTDAEKPVGEVAAYVGPSIKTLPLGIPEDAQELVLTQDGDIYTATYTFGQAGTDYIYVVDDCADCTLCKTGITISPAECPEILIAGEVLYEGDWYVDEDDHVITVTFDVATDGVRVFTSETSTGWEGSAIPVGAVEIDMTTTDNKVFTGTGAFNANADCDTEWIYVLIGDCCEVVCSRTVKVDDEGPYAALEAEMVECDLGDCPPYTEGHYLKITTVQNPDLCDPLYCCGDDCTEEVVHWTVKIYNWNVGGYGAEVQPYDDCCVFEGAPDCELYSGYYYWGTSCNVSYTGLCVADSEIWKLDYKVVVTLEDLVGNTTVYNGILEIDTGGAITATLNDVILSSDCQTWTKSGSDDELGRLNCFNSQ